MSSADRTPAPRPAGIMFLAVVNWAAFVVTLAFWALVYVGRLVPPPGSLQSEVERANARIEKEDGGLDRRLIEHHRKQLSRGVLKHECRATARMPTDMFKRNVAESVERKKGIVVR